MAKPASNFPVVTFPFRLTVPIFVRFVYDEGGPDEYQEVFRFNPGLYETFIPTQETTADYGAAYDSTVSASGDGTFLGLFGEFLKAFMDNLYTDLGLGGSAPVYAGYARYGPSPSVVPSNVYGDWIAPASSNIVVRAVDSSVKEDIKVQFSQDVTNLTGANPDTVNVNADIMGNGPSGIRFWTLLGYGQVGVGSALTRTMLLRKVGNNYAPHVGKFNIGSALEVVFTNLPFRNVWCPNQDVWLDERRQVSAVGFAKNRFSNNSTVKQWGVKRTVLASNFPYVVAPRVQQHKNADSAYYNMLNVDFLGGALNLDLDRVAQAVTVWEDIYEAVLDNLSLTLIISPIFPAPPGTRERVRGKWLNESDLQDWGETFTDSEGDLKYFSVTLGIEEDI